MRKSKTARAWLLLLIVALPGGISSAGAQSTSPNYQIDETFFGSGGDLDSSSSNYEARLAAGELATGGLFGTAYEASAGFNTTDEEVLEFAVSGGPYDFGTLDESTVKTVSTTFGVRSYLADGYVVYATGSTLENNGSNDHVLTPLTAPSVSVPGTEQFGINLVANTSPAVGADPSQYPDASFSYGYAASDYDTADQFTYNDMDVIARSDSSSGQTIYTISMIANISTRTPGGVYGGSISLIIAPTF